MTLSATFDTFEAVIADTVTDDPGDDAHAEPVLAAAPFFVEFDEPARLDPERAGLIWELQPAAARAIRWRSPAASLLMHLLPVVAILLFPLVAVEPPAEIPVQLVFEPPPPPPQPQQQPQPAPKPPQLQQPPRGPLSSVDQGRVKPLDLGRSPDPVQPPAAGPQQPSPAETQTAMTPAPPLPEPKPSPPKEHQPAFQLPKPSGAPNAQRAETPREAPHAARYAGPAATKDEYLAYLVALTRQHMNLLPMSMVGNRRGETVVSVVVYDNGGIGPLGVTRSSGYPDIDERIEQMVRAVGKFPPLPQWYQGKAVQLELTLRFPEALELR